MCEIPVGLVGRLLLLIELPMKEILLPTRSFALCRLLPDQDANELLVQPGDFLLRVSDDSSRGSKVKDWCITLLSSCKVLGMV